MIQLMIATYMTPYEFYLWCKDQCYWEWFPSNKK